MPHTPSTVPNIGVFFLSGAAEAMPNTADQLPQNLDEIKRLDRASRRRLWVAFKLLEAVRQGKVGS
jgi:hypothetical protein